MPFGLCDPLAKLQEIMYRVLKDYIGKICYAYMYDVINYFKGKSAYYNDLEGVLKELVN